MRREDFGFVVSRALAVWMAIIAVHSLTSLTYLVSDFASAKSAFSHGFFPRALLQELMDIAAEVGLGTLLWIKADSFGRLGRGTRPIVEPADVESTILPDEASSGWVEKLQPTLLGAVGLFTCLQAIEAGTRSFMASRALDSRTFDKQTWIAYAIQAAAGAAVFIGYTYGDWFRRIFEYRD